MSNKLLWIKNEGLQRLHKSNMDYTSLFCCGLAFAIYLNTLNAGFVYDDRRAILANTDVSGTQTPTTTQTTSTTTTAWWTRLFMNDFWGTPLTDSGSHGSWRPLCVLSFRLNYLLGGGYVPLGFHLANNLLHCLATGLVVRVARSLLSSVWGVLATGALFAAHPIHTEAVAGVVGRADVAACVCFLLTYLIYLKHIRWREKGDPRQWLALVLTLLMSVAALLFKETAITALLVCGMFDLLRGLCSGQADKHRTRSICIVGAALFCTVYCRLIVLPRPQTAFANADNPIARTPAFWTRLLTFLYLPVFNFKLLLQPQVLSFDWGMDAIPRITSICDRRNFQSCCFYGALTTVVWRCLRLLWRRHKEQHQQSSSLSASSLKQQSTNYTQYHIQSLSTRKSRSKRKRHAQLASSNQQDEPKFAYESTREHLQSHHQLSAYSALPLAKHLSRDCNNNNNNSNNNNNNSMSNLLFGSNSASNTTSNVGVSCCLSQHLVSSNCVSGVSVLSLALHKALARVTPPRSSSSCSNSTTASNKSSGSNSSSASSCSSLASSVGGTSNVLPACGANASELRMLPADARNACVLLMSCAFLTLPFLPATNLFFYVGFVVAERLLYLPSVGFCLLIGFGVSKLLQATRGPSRTRRHRKWLVASCLTLMLSACSLRTIYRNLDWRDEESLFRSAVTVNPPKALGNLGSVLSSQGRYEEAKAALNEAIKHRPNMADVHFNLGILHQNQQDYKMAVECFQRAIHYRPNLAVAYLNLGISFLALGQQQEAIEILQVGTRLEGRGVRDRAAHDQARSSAYLQLGALYVEQGKLQRALAIYREALATLPRHFQPRDVLYQRIGDVFGRLQQWDEAERHHRAALELQPNEVATHLSYGITLARNLSRAAEAEHWFKRALQLAPQQASVYHHYAEFLALQARHQEAVIYHLRAAELAPKDYALVVAAATALRLLDRKVEAEHWYRNAVALRPDDAHAHTNLGAILHLLGRTSNAAASYKEALRLQPGDPITLGNLAKLGHV